MRRLSFLLTVAVILICGNEQAFAQRRIAETLFKLVHVLTKDDGVLDKLKIMPSLDTRSLYNPIHWNYIENGPTSNLSKITFPQLAVPEVVVDYLTPRTTSFSQVFIDSLCYSLAPKCYNYSQESSSLWTSVGLPIMMLNDMDLTYEQRSAIVNELSTNILSCCISGHEAEVKKYILELLPYMKTKEERVVFAKILVLVNSPHEAMSFNEFNQTNKSLISTDFSPHSSVSPSGTKITPNSVFINQASQGVYSDLLFEDALDEFECGNDSLGIMTLNLSKSVAARPRQSVKAAYLLAYIDGDSSKLDSIITCGENDDIYRIAELYKTGQIVEKDRGKYISILELAPSFESMTTLAQELESEEDRKLEMYEKFDARGYCDSTSLIFRADHYYEKGLSGKADSLYVRAYEKDFLSTDRIYRLAFSLEDSDVTMALTLYDEAAEKGYSDAVNRISEMYMNGDRVEIDYDKAYHYLNGCKSASPDLCCTLGRIYMDGKKVAKDYNKAQDLLSIAYDNENITAGKYLKKIRRKLK